MQHSSILRLSADEELRRHEEKVRKNKEFLQNERNLEINRSNQALLNKLVEISAGKWSSVPQRERSSDPYGARSTFSFASKSLNINFRKRETERIERENHAFARRLFERGANLSKKKLDDDYHNHKKHLKLITKMKGVNTGSLAIAAGLSLNPNGPFKQYSKGEPVHSFNNTGHIPEINVEDNANPLD